jgi:hypothetical protein
MLLTSSQVFRRTTETHIDELESERAVMNNAVQLDEISHDWGPQNADRNQQAIDYLKNYITAYDKQAQWEEYSERTILDDMLYGLGVALRGDNQETGAGWAPGYIRWKKLLVSTLSNDLRWLEERLQAEEECDDMAEAQATGASHG